jgi:hypothetical protein
MLQPADDGSEQLQLDSLLLEDAPSLSDKVVGAFGGQMDGSVDTAQPVSENFFGCGPVRVPLGQFLLRHWVFGVPVSAGVGNTLWIACRIARAVRWRSVPVISSTAAKKSCPHRRPTSGVGGLWLIGVALVRPAR